MTSPLNEDVAFRNQLCDASHHHCRNLILKCRSDLGFYDKSHDTDLGASFEEGPWKNNPDYFKRVIIAAPAAAKMLSHSTSGGSIEIMGLLQGRVRGDTFLVTDCFRLPVEGTETRVNAGEAANEYMVRFTELNELTRFSADPVIGWYHSHPGYGCWLSGIDVATQSLYQSHQDPFVAIVIDPKRSLIAGRIEIGAFRTFPEGHVSNASSVRSTNPIPREKVKDFGMHSDRYYSLDVEMYATDLDYSVIEQYSDSTTTDIPRESRMLQAREDFVNGMTEALHKAKLQSHSSVEQFCRSVNTLCTRLSVEKEKNRNSVVTEDMDTNS